MGNKTVKLNKISDNQGIKISHITGDHVEKFVEVAMKAIKSDKNPCLGTQLAPVSENLILISGRKMQVQKNLGIILARLQAEIRKH